MPRFLLPLLSMMLPVLAGPVMLHAAPAGVAFVPSSEAVDCYDYMEITLNVSNPDTTNPFTDVHVEGRFTRQGAPEVSVEGFCDSTSGDVFRVRFLPAQAGEYEYSVTYRQGTYQATHKGRFLARKGTRRGLLRVATRQWRHPCGRRSQRPGEQCGCFVLPGRRSRTDQAGRTGPEPQGTMVQSSDGAVVTRLT